MAKIPARILSKVRPEEFKTVGREEYFRNLELILSDLQISSGEASAVSFNTIFGFLQGKLDELFAAISDSGPMLTIDTTSFTIDSTFIDVSLA